MRTIFLTALTLSILGCSNPVEDEASDEGFPETLRFGPQTMEPGGESDDICVSWTLDTTEPTYIRAITSTNGPGIHHSNWYWVPPRDLGGDDGVWSCEERGFDSVSAAIAGGLIYGTSTQAPRDEQRFAEGAALRIPAGARIIGNIHVLNSSASPVEAEMGLEFESVPAAEVGDELNLLGWAYTPLDIEPRATSRFVADCDVSSLMGDTEPSSDLRLYYGLAHYHELGTAARVEVLGGPRDGEVVFETVNTTGDSLAHIYEPSLELSGVEKLRFSCQFDNPRDEAVGWGIGDQEMCAIGFYTNAPVKAAAVVFETDEVEETDGTFIHTGRCGTTTFR